MWLWNWQWVWTNYSYFSKAQGRPANFSVLAGQCDFWHLKAFGLGTELRCPLHVDETHMQTQISSCTRVCMHTHTTNTFLLFQLHQSVLISDKQVWPILIFPFMSLNGKLSQMFCAPIEKHCLPLVLGHFCLGESPPRGTVIFSGCGLRANYAWGAVSDLRAWREILKGAGCVPSQAHPASPCQLDASARISGFYILQSPWRQKDKEELPEATHGYCGPSILHQMFPSLLQNLIGLDRCWPPWTSRNVLNSQWKHWRCC